MMQNLRDRLLGLLDELSCRLSFFFHRLKSSVPASPIPARELIRGTSHQMIVVTPPDTEMFREAMFILQDDYMRRTSPREELLREAQEAAEEYAGRFVRPQQRRSLWPELLLPLLTALGGFVLGLVM